MTFSFDDKDIMKKMQKGDFVAFEKVFNKYYSKLCLFAEGYVKEPAIAEEIVTELFSKLWEKRKSIEISSSVKSYLFHSVHNNCLKYLEHLKVLKKYETFATTMIQSRDLLHLSDNSYPLANLISREIEIEIESAINCLPEKCREIFCMHRFDDLNYNEIAQKLDISVNTVRTQMMRALQKLRESLKEYLPSSQKKTDL